MAGDGHFIRVGVSNGKDIKVFLYSHYGEKTILVDSAQSDQSGNIVFYMDDGALTGLYEIRFPNNRFMRLLYNNEDVHLFTDASYPADSLRIIQSFENEIYYEYMRLSGDVFYRLSILEPVMNYYPRNNDFFSEAAREVQGLIKQEQEFVEEITRNYPHSLATRYIRFTRTNIPDPFMPPQWKNEVRKRDFFKTKDFTDSLLLQTDAYTGKVIEYLTFFRNPDYNFDEQEKAFIRAVDTLLLTNDMHDAVFSSIVQYLVGGFEKFKFERALSHIYEKYIPLISCTDETVQTNLEKRLSQYAKIVPGVPAPDFNIPDINGKIVHLYDCPASKILLIFWASWCPHCKQELATLKSMIASDNKAAPELPQIIAVSVDSEEKKWRDEVLSQGYSWSNCAELKGWNGLAVTSYYIFATPTFILLGPDKKIIEKSGTLSEISKFF
jgi:thiol-disulfide isomerase/thioredoxin